MSRKSVEPPSGLANSDVQAFCDEIQSHLASAVHNAGASLQQSDAVAKEVAKRTAPSYRANHLTIESAIMNYMVDLNDIGTRVRRYQYIERYRDFHSGSDKDMMLSLLEHTHALKGHEIYVILERGAELLKFGGHLASNLHLPGKDNSKGYTKRLKREFEYRLRERHRMVHAHERPSLLSRMLNLNAEILENPKARRLLQKGLQDIFKKIQQLQANGLDRDLGAVLGQDRSAYLRRGDAEAALIWETVKEFTRENVGLSVHGSEQRLNTMPKDDGAL